MIITPQILWEGCDPNAYPLKPSIVSTMETVDYFCYSLYFDGLKTTYNAVARIFAKLYTPKSDRFFKSASNDKFTNDFGLIKNLTNNAIVVFNDINKSVDSFKPNIYIDEGFCVLVVDYAGFDDKKSRFTIYPKNLKQANYHLNQKAVLDMDIDPKDSSWYIWQTVALRAVACLRRLNFKSVFMIGIGHGLEMVFKSSYFINNIDGGATILSGGVAKSSNVQYLAALDATAYAQYSKCPILMQVASNENNSSLDGINSLFETLDTYGEARFLIKENSIACIDYTAPLRWFKAILNGDTFYSSPILKARASQNKLYFNVEVSSCNNISKISLNVAHGEEFSAFRSWRQEPLQSLGEGEYLTSVDILDCEKPIFAFVNVKYECGSEFSSNILTVLPKNLDISLPPAAKKRLIYDTDMGLRVFDTGKSVICNCYEDNCDAASLSIQVGALGLDGLSSDTNSLSTFRLCDNQYTGNSGDSLQLMIQALEPISITFSILSKKYNTHFEYIKEFDGSESWIKTSLILNDFKSKNGDSLNSWQDVLTFYIKASGKFLLNSTLWV